ncbi:MAG: asparagine--tRNA ligase [Desulfobacterales bacterium]|nr:asparagine--tRNA ligase [Desulfobacterales bacterium]
MKRSKIKALLERDTPIDNVLIKGWLRTKRDSKGFSFLEINDGSCLKNIQVIANESLENYENIKKLNIGSAVAVNGKVIKSPAPKQKWEVYADLIDIISITDESYPLQKKRHSDEYLRTIAHLRPRTNKYGAVFRIRSEIAYAIHKFFKEKGFFYIHTPIITASDCEGAGEMFQIVSNFDFFGKSANLTVSGQLSAELLALAISDVYTFGPTFRAENSNTRRHAAEFWMIEPEMAFYDLQENMELAEELILYLIKYALTNCAEDIELFAKFIDTNLIKTLDTISNSTFIKISYKEAINILIKSGKKFEYDIKFGIDLQSEHECFLSEEYFKSPVIIYNYPKSIKAFYMRLNDDNETVAAMDVLVPRIGELIGGSQREERLDILEYRMDEIGLPKNKYWWYLDSRRFGSVPHSGFGMGFERLIMLITGITNIRDVIPFPRTPNNLEF